MSGRARACPPPGQAPRSAMSRSKLSAARTLAPRTAARPPANSWRVTRVPSAPATAMNTSPTGFSALPPSGPAMPVSATDRSAPLRLRAP